MRTAAPVLAVLLAPLVAAAPVPKALKATAPDFYPTAVGTKWVFAHEDGTNEHTREVTASTTNDGVTDFTITWTEAGSTQLWELKKDAAGVHRLKQDQWVYDPPHQILRPKLAEGDEWTSKYSYGGATWTDTRTVGKPEVLKLPAGEITAFPITARQNGSETTLWYADGYGLVKFQPKGGTATVLREFTPGGKK